MKKEDLTNQRFGKLVVIAAADNLNGRSAWKCMCDCGNTCVVTAKNLKAGVTKSCGCYKIQRTREVKTQDLTGQRFGKLTAVYKSFDKKEKSGGLRAYWHCVCDCGGECDVSISRLKSGHTVSCGCKKQESRYEDLQGRKFSKLTVVEFAHIHIQPNGNHVVMWKCKCDCGNECIVSAASLKSGNTKSCGCLALDPKYEDIIGQRFGKLIVQYLSHSKKTPNGTKRYIWHCLCDCGNECDVASSSLKAHLTKSCGCLAHESSYNFLDLSGMRFGRLQVLRRADDYTDPHGNRRIRWHCRCDCGNEKDIDGNSLRTGVTQSCGCIKREQSHEMFFDDLSGQRFGHWLVLYRTDDYVDSKGNKSTKWHCKCDCGNESDVSASNLKSGTSLSCGCVHSRIENFVLQYLNSNEYIPAVDYDYQKKFADLKGVKGGYLSYDFLIYKNGLPFAFIECQGEQHYNPVDFFGGEEQFYVQQSHDNLKRSYAEVLGIPLIEIPYTVDKYHLVNELLKFYDI